MKIVISPAKTLDYKTPLPVERATFPQFPDVTARINRKLSRMSRKNISELMGISNNLAELNHTRYQEFQEEHSKKNSRPAIYGFAGDVYSGLDAYSIAPEKLDFLEDRLRILSGFYGILRPFDLIQPHRLEMHTALPVGRKKNLYEIWTDKITGSLKAEMEDGEVLLNLASKEYFRAVNIDKLKHPVVSPIFKDLSKNGELKIISIFAKLARGKMVRYITDNKITSLEDLRGFDYDGYRYSQRETEKENQPVFTR